MKYKAFVLIALLALCLGVSGAFSADGDLSTWYNSADNEVRLTSTGVLVNTRTDTEVATTNDTVTVLESGKVFLPNISSGTITFTLPTAAAGLTYTFTSINGHATSGQGRVYLDPASTDQFSGCANSSSTSTFANGDSLYSPEATGDSVTIVGASTKWYCVNRVGTYVDGGSAF